MVSLYERALALNPHSAEAQIRLPHQLMCRVLDEMTDTRRTDIERAAKLMERAFPMLPRNAVPGWLQLLGGIIGPRLGD